jgi:casein kinase II subunit alpha
MLVLLVVALYGISDSCSSSKAFSIESNELYDSYEITYHDDRHLTLHEQVGHGRFSQVYRAVLPNGAIVAAKRLKPIESWRLKREVKFMELLRGVPHVIEFIGVYGDRWSPIIVTEFATRDNDIDLTLDDLRWVMRCLLAALNATHYRHVFHRDIKWQNLMVSFHNRTFKLIDWGLAEYIVADRKLASRVGTKTYKAPELLMGARMYGPEVDVWAAGVTMANLMFGCPSFFPGANDREVLARQTRIFGHLRMSRLAKQYRYKWKRFGSERQSILEFALPHTRSLFTSRALDLLGQLLVPERDSRLTAAEALFHPFFD